MLQHRMMQQGAAAGGRARLPLLPPPPPAPRGLRSAAAHQRRPSRVTAASASSSSATTPTASSSSSPSKQRKLDAAPLPPLPSASGRQLVDPAHLCVRASARARLAPPASSPPRAAAAGAAQAAAAAEEEEDASLDAYMRLPVEQYYCLDPSSIAFLGGDRFRLSVGRVALPKALGGAWVEPTVEVRVRAAAGGGGGGGDSEGGAVVLEAERCFLRASPLLEALRLDEKFALRFKARLTWSEDDEQAAAAGGGAGGGGGEIRGDASVDVWCEVLAPFRLVPRAALESACSGVLASLARALLPVFLRQLGDDYRRWAAEPAYRAARRARGQQAGGGGLAGAAAAGAAQQQQQQLQRQQAVQQPQQQRQLVPERVAVR